jgi:IS5 family transposase
MIPLAYWLAEGLMASQPGFWDVEDRYAALSRAGDPLEKLSAVVDFEIFRPILAKAIRRATGMSGGRPPYDVVFGLALEPVAG